MIICSVVIATFDIPKIPFPGYDGDIGCAMISEDYLLSTCIIFEYTLGVELIVKVMKSSPIFPAWSLTMAVISWTLSIKVVDIEKAVLRAIPWSEDAHWILS